MQQDDLPKFSEDLQKQLIDSRLVTESPLLKFEIDKLTQKMIDDNILLLLEKEEPLLLEDYRKWRKESKTGSMFHWRVRRE